MRPLRYPRIYSVIGTLIGWKAYLLMGLIFRLPDGPLTLFLKMVAVPVRLFAGDSPVTRGVDDLVWIFGRGGESAAVLRKLLTQSRPEEIVGIVRGAAIRSLP